MNIHSFNIKKIKPMAAAVALAAGIAMASISGASAGVASGSTEDPTRATTMGHQACHIHEAGGFSICDDRQ